MMKLLFSAALLVTSSVVAQQQTGAPAGIPMPEPPPAQSAAPPAGMAPSTLAFRVRVLDGRSGVPVQDAHVKLWYDEPAGPGYQFATDARGYALMPAPAGEPVRVLATVTDYVDCRKPERGAPPEGYNLATIAKSGAHAQNTCGQASVRTQPGELVLYVRSAHWYEGINRDPR